MEQGGIRKEKWYELSMLEQEGKCWDVDSIYYLKNLFLGCVGSA